MLIKSNKLYHQRNKQKRVIHYILCYILLPGIVSKKKQQTSTFYTVIILI